MIIKGCSLEKIYTSYEEIKKRYVAAQGWSASGDMSFLLEEKDITPFINNLINKENKTHRAFRELLKEVKSGDIILAFEGTTIKGICELPEDFIYMYDVSEEADIEPYEYANSLFPVKWVDWDSISNKKSPGGFRPPNAVFNVKRPDIVSYVEENWERYKKENSFNIQPEECQNRLNKLKISFPIKVKESRDRYYKLLKDKEMNAKLSKYIDLLISNRNIILTGAPGTGKTYLAKEIAETIIKGVGTHTDKVELSYSQFRNIEIDTTEVDLAWNHWKTRILSGTFCLDDFANTVSNVSNEEINHYGSYIMNFLERTSSDYYGSSKPGNALRYGIKMNNDNTTYSDPDGTILDRSGAEQLFESEIKNWLETLLKSDINEQIELVEDGHKIIKAKQLLRKIIILEHTDQLIGIYQDKVIYNAYKYFIPNGNENSYFQQNLELTDHLVKLFRIDKNKKNVLQLAKYVWYYFKSAANENIDDNIDEIENKLIISQQDFVQFHPSYDYTDFVEGLRPEKNEESKELGFVLRDGIIREFCSKAIKAFNEDKEKLDENKRKFVFIIDEINRGEISKIFGELFFSIDPGYRGTKGKVKTQYSNLREEDDQYFYVPDNVYIIGTMNDIDRSVESFDFAMRRRFTWLEITANESAANMNLAKDATDRMKSLNDTILNIEGLNSSYQIGAAYFLKLKDYNNDFDKLWDYHIAPLVKEYLRGMPNFRESYDKLENAYKSVS